ncbi:MAG: transcription termination factor Rho [Verrucomicrobia bacterium GWF2_51_19]|nr:MAG: transcription termination factor Rho [Verrucomicrobia bacterium GWF2_51_19]HCJ12364.1 transcription termination factor Rho [Opitutae bacterium]
MIEDNNEKGDVIVVSGLLEVEDHGKRGHMLDPQRNGRPRDEDPYVPAEIIRKLNLKSGSFLQAKAIKHAGHANPKVIFVDTIDGLTLDARNQAPKFADLTTVAPDKQLKTELEGKLTTRILDLFCPVGKGQRGLIVAPPRTGKTTLLQDIALGVLKNEPDCHVMILLVDERPEEVTDFRRNVPAEIWASSNDEQLKSHVRIAELAIERAKKLVEVGRDVVLLLDSITRLSRAYNTFHGSGRTMTGGLDIRALEKPRQLFSAARNTEEAGSLTILATALIETGSRMDELIFQEFKGTGNMELVLDRKAAEMRLFPAINVNASGTRKEELLLAPKDLEKVHFFRRALASAKIEEATEALIARIKTTQTNREFLNLLKIGC